jgi:hypothetical protein
MSQEVFIARKWASRLRTDAQTLLRAAGAIDAHRCHIEALQGTERAYAADRLAAMIARLAKRYPL